MVQRSTNRKRRVKRRVVHTSRGDATASHHEAQALRQHRTRRYQKRRARLKARQLKSKPRPSAVDQPLPSPQARTTAAMGKTQKKQTRRPPVSQDVSLRRSRIRQNYRDAVDPRSRVHVRRRQRTEKSLQGLRLLVAGVGVALISGFAITLMHPAPKEHHQSKSETLQFQEPTQSSVATTVTPPPPSYEKPGKELRQLKQEVRSLVQQQTDLTTGLFFLNPETEEFVTHRGSEVFPAASMIKLPVLIAFFQDVDAGKVQLNEKLTMRPDLIAGEAGAMQYDDPGSQYDALQTADWMITISDNTATNMIIDRLGGPAVLNQRFQEWGLEHTKINQPLPDLEGQNTMSPKDLAVLMAKVSQGDLLTAHSRDRALEILRHTVTKTLLPQGIDASAQIAHKTGDIGMAVGDAGLIDMPNGQRYVAGIVVKRPHNDPRAQELIRAISKLTYKVFSERPVPRSQPAPAAEQPSQPQ